MFQTEFIYSVLNSSVALYCAACFHSFPLQLHTMCHFQAPIYGSIEVPPPPNKQKQQQQNKQTTVLLVTFV